MPQEISQQKSQQLFSADFPDMWDTSPCESWVMVTTFKMGDESSQGQKTLWATKFFNFVSPLIRYISIGAAQLCDALNILGHIFKYLNTFKFKICLCYLKYLWLYILALAL